MCSMEAPDCRSKTIFPPCRRGSFQSSFSFIFVGMGFFRCRWENFSRLFTLITSVDGLNDSYARHPASQGVQFGQIENYRIAIYQLRYECDIKRRTVCNCRLAAWQIDFLFTFIPQSTKGISVNFLCIHPS